MHCTPLISAVISAAVVLLTAIYWRVKKSYEFFAKKDIEGPSPTFLVGTWNSNARQFIGDEDARNIEKYGGMVGTFDGTTPNLLITTAELIQQILTTDKTKFRSRRAENAKNKTLQRTLRILDEEQPKEVTCLLASCTRRMNKLLPKVNSAAKALVRRLLDAREENIVLANHAVDDYMEEITATAILGLDLNEDPVFRQRFVKQSKKITSGSTSTSVLALLTYLYGGSENSTFSVSTLEYFKSIITTRLNELTNKSQSSDAQKDNTSLIDILVALAAEEKQTAMKEKAQESAENDTLEDSLILSKSLITELTLAAVVAVLHYAKSTLIFSIHVLATEKLMSEKLCSESKRNQEQITTEKELTLEQLDKLQYLTAFDKEVHRKYPVEFRIEKISTEVVKLTEELELPAKSAVTIPVYAINKSQQFHKEPHTFSPERFLSENYEKQHPVYNLPVVRSLLSVVRDLATKVAVLKIASALELDTAVDNANPYMNGLTGLPIPSPLKILISNRE